MTDTFGGVITTAFQRCAAELEGLSPEEVDKVRAMLFPAVQGRIDPLHPEAFCQRCHRPNMVWFAPNEVWNKAMPDEGGILCPVCFIVAAELAGIKPTAWCVSPEPDVQMYRREWKEGWPRGTWLRTIGTPARIVESPGYLAQDSEGSKGYLVPLVSGPGYRQELVYLSMFCEARTPDGDVYRRVV